MINFVKPSVNGYVTINLFGGFQLAELAGRNCYKTEDKRSPGSYKKFLNMIINKGHLSILEHCPLYLEVSDNIIANKDNNSRNLHKILLSYFSRYNHIKETCKFHIYTNFRVIYENYPELAIQLLESTPANVDDILSNFGLKWFIPESDDKYIRYTLNITTLRSITDELVRERIVSSAVESTRWCDYSPDNRIGNLTFCLPHWINENVFDKCFKSVLNSFKNQNIEDLNTLDKFHLLYNITSIFYDENIKNKNLSTCYIYILQCIDSAINYNKLKINVGLNQEDAREILPLGIKSDIIYSAYYEDFERIIDKRLNDSVGRCHSNMHVIMKDIKIHLNEFRGQKSRSN